MDFDRQMVGAALKSKRNKLGYTMETASEKCYISTTTISHIERGLPIVSDEKYIEYAKFLNLESDLYGIASEQKEKEDQIKDGLLELEDTIYVNPEAGLALLNNLDKNLTLKTSAIVHYTKGIAFFALKDRKKSTNKFLTAIKIINEPMSDLGHTNLRSVCFNYLSKIAFQEANFEKALEYTQEGIKYFSLDGERPHYLYFLLINKAIYLDKLNRTEKCLTAIDQLQTKINLIKDPSEITRSVKTSVIIQMYYMYATVLLKQKRPEKAIEYATKGLTIAKINNDFDRIFTLWATMGTIYARLGRLDTAEKFYRKALSIKSKVSKEYLLISAFIDLGLLFIKQGEPNKAQEYIREALDISLRNADILGETEALQALGKCLLFKKAYKSAIDKLHKAEDLAEKHNFPFQSLEIISDLCDCFDATQDDHNFKLYTEKLYRSRKKLRNSFDQT